ncbi:hypothetical protein AGMMS49965_00260 [Bacteroidia bacterium]|nr:hypothetical protein AGMMS49965_00260 [Bacteroidia bacterium]
MKTAIEWFNEGFVACETRQYQEAIDCLNKAIEIDPNFAPAYYNRGGAKGDLGRNEEAIEDFNKAIEINPNYANAYNNRGTAKSDLGQNEEAIEDHLICLYLLVSNRNSQEFTRLPDLLSKLQAYPQNIFYTYEKLDIDWSSYLNSGIEIYEQLEDFDSLLNYYQQCKNLPEREMLSVKALLYYYLGGNIPAFIIYDEQLDNGEDLTAQELYYYAKAAKEINWEADAIIKDNIRQLNERAADSEDFYYLGHLHIINEDVIKANDCFEKSSEYLFSKIMLNVLANKEIAELTQGLKLKGEIEYNQDISQFNDYIHYMECMCVGGDELPFWERFKFSEQYRGEIHRAERKIETEKLLNEILKEKQEKQILPPDSIKVADKWLALKNKGGSIVFKGLKEDIDKLKGMGVTSEELERKIAEAITDLEDAPKNYLYIIRYAFLIGKMEGNAEFNLTAYLRYRVGKMKYDMAIDNLLEIGGNIPGTAPVAKFIKSIRGFDRFDEETFNKAIEGIKPENDEKKDVYELFKKNLWKEIRMDMDNENYEALKRKWGCFSWFEDEVKTPTAC